MSVLQRDVNSALRTLIRAQRITFQGDRAARIAARQLNRAILQPALSPSSTQEEAAQAILGARQTAQYFRQNVLQGAQNEKGRYALRFTPETALGDNDTIKNVSPAPSLETIRGTMNARPGGKSPCQEMAEREGA